MFTFRSSLCTMGLHCDMGIEMVESTIGLFAAVPSALVHALNLLVPPSGALMLLCTWNRYE